MQTDSSHVISRSKMFVIWISIWYKHRNIQYFVQQFLISHVRAKNVRHEFLMAVLTSSFQPSVLSTQPEKPKAYTVIREGRALKALNANLLFN